MYTTSVVCLVSGMWRSMVCGLRSVVCGGKWYVGISAMCGKWHGRSTVFEG